MRPYVNNAKVHLIAIAHIIASVLLGGVIALSVVIPGKFLWLLVGVGVLLFPGVLIVMCVFLLSGCWYAETLRPIDRQYRSSSWWYKIFFSHRDSRENAIAVVVFRNHKKTCLFPLGGVH